MSGYNRQFSAPKGTVSERKTLSQNFLRKGAGLDTYLAVVAESIDVKSAVEVGAGDGRLTRQFSKLYGNVVAWELDEKFSRRASDALRGMSNARVKTGDFVASAPPATPFDLLGNIPFGITSEIVEWALLATYMNRACVITQLEYARKKTGGYGRWSKTTIATWPTHTWALEGVINKKEFTPVPRVDCGILVLRKRPEALLNGRTLQLWARDVEVGFRGKGGSLYKSLQEHYRAGALKQAFNSAGVGRDTVVAFVAPEEWSEIFSSLQA